MIFSSAIFLYCFLPLTLLGYYLLPWRMRNMWLLLASLLFYAWGEPRYVLLMLASIGINWWLGKRIDAAKDRLSAKAILSAGVTINLLGLCYFKYAGFITANVNAALAGAGYAPLIFEAPRLPLGISFFTFHAISYIVDIYRREAQALKSPFDMGLYISLFPQLIAGPIVRFHDIAAQLTHRRNNLPRFASGVERFVFGLGKKLLIADMLGQTADQAFATPVEFLSGPTAWLGIICYTLQIYFDFSGYSDMAIGLGRMFGFELLENFNYPYISRSVREFWRRWHLSLSTWFRDYLYIPLGGNRVGRMRQTINLVTVFLLCGLWHGASWNFILWGAWHGVFLAAERNRQPIAHPAGKALGLFYTMMVIVIGWVMFRSSDVTQTLHYLSAMAGFAQGHGFVGKIVLSLNARTYCIIAIGIILSTPAFSWLARDWHSRLFPRHVAPPPPMPAPAIAPGLITSLRIAGCLIILLLSMMSIAASTYHPFIYYRF